MTWWYGVQVFSKFTAPGEGELLNCSNAVALTKPLHPFTLSKQTKKKMAAPSAKTIRKTKADNQDLEVSVQVRPIKDKLLSDLQRINLKYNNPKHQMR